MPEYDNTNSGALFRNERKETDKHPDYRGEINVNGEEFWLSAWLKASKKGTRYMSLSLTPKGEQKSEQKPEQKSEPFDDEIPF